MNGEYTALVELTQQTIPATLAYGFACFVVFLLLWIAHKYG